MMSAVIGGAVSMLLSSRRTYPLCPFSIGQGTDIAVRDFLSRVVCILCRMGHGVGLVFDLPCNVLGVLLWLFYCKVSQ